MKKDFGGKANSLSLLRKKGFKVPEFFTLSRSFYIDFLIHNNVLDIIQDLFNKKQFEKIGKIVKNCTFTDEEKKFILDSIKYIGGNTYAIRSSAQNEDGEDKSYAGQYDSFLNVRKNEVLDSIKKCWASLYNDSVVEYSKNKNYDLYSMNVIVQKMIDADFSGVAFSINPADLRNNYSYIEACIGLGDKLVSGEITPTSYIVRRQTKKIDLIKNKNILKEEKVLEIETELLKIEELYNTPIDIEWCIKDNNLYIIQARPITARSPEKNIIKNILTRSKKLWQIELIYQEEYLGINKITNNLYYQNPILKYISEAKTEYYYDTTSLEESPGLIFRTLEENFDSFYKTINRAYKTCEKLKEEVKTGIFDFKSLIDDITFIYPFQTIGNIAGRDWDVSDRVKKELIYFRENYDDIPYKCEGLINEYLKKELPDSLKKYFPVLKIEEILNQDKIDMKELEKRLNGFIYYQGEIHFESFEEFCEKHNYYVEGFDNDKANGKVTGESAYPGVVKGAVKIIFSRDEFDKFNKGDILVTPMTTPKFMKILTIASGIITDEGGITCHAAIVSRELKKPCLIGCKTATKVFKDGDIVLLDADKKMAKIIKE